MSEAERATDEAPAVGAPSDSDDSASDAEVIELDTAAPSLRRDGASGPASAAAAPPLLQQWGWTRDGALSGYVFGREGFRQGELMTTSTIVAAGDPPTPLHSHPTLCEGDAAVTKSGSTSVPFETLQRERLRRERRRRNQRAVF